MKDSKILQIEQMYRDFSEQFSDFIAYTETSIQVGGTPMKLLNLIGKLIALLDVMVERAAMLPTEEVEQLDPAIKAIVEHSEIDPYERVYLMLGCFDNLF